MKQEIRDKLYEVLEQSKDHEIIVKSYADMCELLEEEKYQHQAQIKQKKRWKREIEYTQNGREYIFFII